jgi:hypothetical protein
MVQWVMDPAASCLPVAFRFPPMTVFGGIKFLVRAKVNVRANCRGVNSVFLVQLRKRVSGRFRGRMQVKKNLLRAAMRAGASLCDAEESGTEI